MNRNIWLSLIVVVLALFSFLNCQKKTVQSSVDSTKIMKQLNDAMSGNYDKETAQKNLQIIADSLKNDVLPTVADNEKGETSEIIKYFEDLKSKIPEHLEDGENFIQACKMFMRLSELFARIDPKNFDANLAVSSNYVYLAVSILQFNSSSEKHLSANEEFNEKGVQAAKALVDKFPDNPMSYGQLAHSILVTGGDEKEVVGLLNKCLEVDKNSQYCKDFLGRMKES